MFSVGTQIPELLVTAIEELNVESVTETETETESCAVENNYSSNSKSVSSERDYQVRSWNCIVDTLSWLIIGE